METEIKDTCLYIHTRKSDGGIFYVGIGDKFRPNSKRGRNKYWKNITNKHGFEVKVLVNNLTWDEACKLEIKMIAFYGRMIPSKENNNYGCLCNLTDGGDGSKGCNPTKKTRKKLSVKRKQIIKNSNDNKLFGVKGFGLGKIESMETRLKKSNSKIGEKNSFYKKNHSQETKKKIGESHKGKIISEEQRKKISENHTRQNSKKVIDIVTNKIYNSLTEAAVENNINYSTLRGWLNPKKTSPNKSNLRWL